MFPTLPKTVHGAFASSNQRVLANEALNQKKLEIEIVKRLPKESREHIKLLAKSWRLAVKRITDEEHSKKIVEVVELLKKVMQILEDGSTVKA